MYSENVSLNLSDLLGHGFQPVVVGDLRTLRSQGIDYVASVAVKLHELVCRHRLLVHKRFSAVIYSIEVLGRDGVDSSPLASALLGVISCCRQVVVVGIFSLLTLEVGLF